MTRDFLSRWSRLKSEADKAAQREPDADVADPGPREVRLPDEPVVEASSAVEGRAELAAEAGAELTADEITRLPPVEEVVSASDLAPYLRSGVPALLRNAALRRMWTIDPAIRDYVGDACEYAYDWNVPGGAPGCGPLLPGDDVKAMVRRIFDRPPPDAEAVAENREAESAAAAGPDGEASGATDPDAADRGETAALTPPAAGEPDETPTPQSVAVERLSTGAQATVTARIRRH